MADFYDTDAVPTLDLSFEDSTTIEEKITQSLKYIENTLQWYDHMACAFLLYDSPNEAYQKIRLLHKNYFEKKTGWDQVVLRPLLENSKNNHNVCRKLIEALYLLKYYSLLDLLDISVNSTESIDPLRLLYFYKIDSMSPKDAKLWAQKISLKVGLGSDHPHETENPNSIWGIELQCLKWIENGAKIPKDFFVIVPSCDEKFQNSLLPRNNLAQSLPQLESTGVSHKNSSSDKYEINHGLCVIINQMGFYVNKSSPPMAKHGLPYRYGSDIDRDRIQETFLMLGHDVEIHENLDIASLTRVIKGITRYNLKQFDGLVICILSHGDKGVIYTSDSIPVSVDQIKVYFDGSHSPDLKLKPKLFFLQACQGQAKQVSKEADNQTDGSLVKQTVPNFSDFLEAWATVPGYLSFRSTRFGAVFVRVLCSVFQKYGHKEGLTDLMTRVNGQVSCMDSGERIQMPCNSNCLTRGVQFRRNQDKFVQAILKKFERKLLERAMKSAACTLLEKEYDTALKMFNSWRL